MLSSLVFTLILLCLGFQACSGWAYKVATPNMLPTLNVGDVCVIDKFAYSSKPIGRFDIVVLNAPEDITKISGESDLKIIKRVIGLPTETVEIRDNVIYINSKALVEPFDKLTNEKDIKKNFPLFTIPDGEYFLLGDNRPESFDSRLWKHPTVKRSDIVGRVERIVPAGDR